MRLNRKIPVLPLPPANQAVRQYPACHWEHKKRLNWKWSWIGLVAINNLDLLLSVMFYSLFLLTEIAPRSGSAQALLMVLHWKATKDAGGVRWSEGGDKEGGDSLVQPIFAATWSGQDRDLVKKRSPCHCTPQHKKLIHQGDSIWSQFALTNFTNAPIITTKVGILPLRVHRLYKGRHREMAGYRFRYLTRPAITGGSVTLRRRYR